MPEARPDRNQPVVHGEPLERTARVAREAAGPNAEEVDRKARLPREAIDGLRAEALLSCFVPESLGGEGADLGEVAAMCTELGRRCAASGMIFAMHQIQVASLVNHAAEDPAVQSYLRDLVREQRLIASVTSEVGTGGDLRRSIACVESGSRDPAEAGSSEATEADAEAEAKEKEKEKEFRFEKATTTSSYCEYADDLLLTLRRNEEAASGDQVLVLVKRGGFVLSEVGEWDTLGMRGTCSPPVRVAGGGERWQILSEPFRTIATTTMVPVSHILWAAVWQGIALDAFDRARRCVQVKSRKDPEGTAMAAGRLADLSTRVSRMRAQLLSVLDGALANTRETGRPGVGDPRDVLALNDLKLAASEDVVDIVSDALRIVGIAGYRNEGEFSLGRHLRDAHSAALMINNDRIRATNADLLTVYKGS